MAGLSGYLLGLFDCDSPALTALPTGEHFTPPSLESWNDSPFLPCEHFLFLCHLCSCPPESLGMMRCLLEMLLQWSPLMGWVCATLRQVAEEQGAVTVWPFAAHCSDTAALATETQRASTASSTTDSYMFKKLCSFDSHRTSNYNGYYHCRGSLFW